MRPHLLRLLESKELIQFPYTPRKSWGNPKRDIFVIKNLQEKKITKAEQTRASRNNPEIRLKEMERDRFQIQKDRFCQNQHSKNIQQRIVFVNWSLNIAKLSKCVTLKHIVLHDSSLSIAKLNKYLH